MKRQAWAQNQHNSQSAFFKLANIIPFEDALGYMKAAAEASYSKKGQDVVEKNWNAIDGHQNIVKIDVPAAWADAADTQMGMAAVTCEDKNLQDYVNKIQIPCNAQKGDTLPFLLS